MAGREEGEGNAMGSELRENSYGWVSAEAARLSGGSGCGETERQTLSHGTLHGQEDLGNQTGIFVGTG